LEADGGAESTRIYYAAGFIDDDDLQFVLDGADAELFVNGTSIGTYDSLTVVDGTVFEVDDGQSNGAVMDAVELWPYYINTPFKL
jgi:hypothetical protein